MEIYDKIAESYTRCSLSDIKRHFTTDYTFLNLIGDVRGKSVLDLACGEGYYCRPLKHSGAAKVVGVDISSKMIDLARDKEAKDHLGIRYECMDALKLPVIGRFDIVLGSFLLHYSRTKEELATMCRNIYANLKEGGRFIGINSSPDKPLQPDERYGVTRICEGPVRDGCVIRITMYENGKAACVFDNYHWTRKTYENAFISAGFKNIVWHGIGVSREGIDRFGIQFWGPYLKQPGIAFFECSR